ncbi:1461_t:CDS:2 [Acaulospora morrowiae]|uniref:1461_t:CDS:1 n=1 Tax=Acaulospora morrowiae TaxID=94023 RepID=A0A9N9CDA3_9GLOM|nr:1461_t:CDS:2 [Acaulospora morrowiae]
MVANNVQLSSDTQSEDSEITTPTSERSPELRNENPTSSPSKNSTTKFPGKDLPPPTIDQTPTRFLAACSKLDLEPNPFEQSFSGVAPISDSVGTNSPKPSLPPVSQIESPSLPSNEEYGWNLQSLRSGALSPSMLAGPQENIMFDSIPPGRTGTTPLPFTSFAEPSPRSAALFGVAGNLSTSIINPALPVTSLSTTANATDPYGRNVFTQGIPRTLTDSERKITTNSVTSVSVPKTQSGVIQPGVTTLPSTGLLNMSNGTSVSSSSMIGHQNVLVGNSTINNRNMLAASTQDTISNALISETIMPKTEKDDFSSQTNNTLNALNNGRQSNGINSSLLTHKASSLSDSMDEESIISSKINSSSSLKSGARGTRRKAEEPLINEQPSSKKSGQKVKNEMTEEEKRKNFLERNRQAALKCRQRKKQWLANLQSKVEFLTNDNENLQNQAQSLREEIINLKTLLLAHKDCPIAQANGVMGLDSIQPNSQGIPQNMNGMNIGPNGVPMGMVQSGVANSGMSSGVQGSMSMTNVQVPPHMSNHVTGPPGSGLMRY